MITDKDIAKLKKVFATKDDLKNFATKDDLKEIRQEINRFTTKDDLQNLKKDLRKDMRESFTKLIEMMTDGTTRILQKLDDRNDEIKGQRIQIGDHENRIEEIENKVFPQT